MKNRIKVIVVWVVVLNIIFATAVTVNAADENVYTYLLSDGEVIITGVVDKNAFSLLKVIPGEIGGCSVTRIENRAFSSCKNLTNVTIEYGVTSIGDYAFTYCDKLYNVTLPHSLKSIQSFAFSSCKSLENIIIPYGVTNISGGAFLRCEKLENVIIPSSVEKIDTITFADCTNLRSVLIPRSVNYIYDDAFENCEKLEILGYANSYAESYARQNSIPFVALQEDLSTSYSFGQSVQIGLIEPWFLKANARVYTDAHPTNIDYSSLVDYGAYFIRASALSDKNATQESLTVEDIINNPASSKYSKSAGTATVDGSYITANYDKGLYTYELDDSVFVLFYVIDDAGITYAPIRERNLKSLLEARCNDVANFPNELERAVYKNMLAMFDAISAYRDDYFSKS